MAINERLSGNEAVAYAIRQINPDVMPAFPITPSTEIPQLVANYIANGQMDTEFIPVESEHSSMSAAMGASAAGARALTATSSCGLAYMWELLYVAASDRLPIALALVNRALTGPININCDHSDSMGAKDAGWLQIYSESNQEAYDNFIMAYRIAEHKDVRLPIMICQDGFITSHALTNIQLIEDDLVKKFVGEYKPENFLLNSECPMSVGPYAVSNYYMESHKAQVAAMENSKQVILDVADEFYKMTGRRYGFFEEYRMDDAEAAIVIMGSAAGTTKDAVDELREQGIKAGMIKLRVFRPFPAEEICKALSHLKAVAILDRSETFSTQGGPVASEICAAMYRSNLNVKSASYIYGLGGRDYRVSDAINVYNELFDYINNGKELVDFNYIGLRSRED
ncbi:MAG: pyruvate ferredoxin oxidoreductase [Clostridiales bacterium]|nr:pyruvate ferredoxin oxidoreductase [Clostridiales bacterium]